MALQFYVSLDESRVEVTQEVNGDYTVVNEPNIIPGFSEREKTPLPPNHAVVKEFGGLNYTLMYKALHAVLKDNYLAKRVSIEVMFRLKLSVDGLLIQSFS